MGGGVPGNDTTIDQEIISELADTEAGDLKSNLAPLLIRDELTRLYNRAYFRARLQRELAVASAERPLALLLLDVDRFKEFNDRYGHLVGDRALREVARVLMSVPPPRGAACRLGGDEFALLVPDTSVDGARWLQIELTQAITRCQVPTEGPQQPSLGASIGLALAPLDGVDPEVLFRKADAAMYSAKRRRTGYRDPARDAGRGPLPLVGRGHLVSTLEQTLAAVESSTGRMVIFAGPAGIGKTRLAQEAVARARARGFRLLQSSLTGMPPLATVRQLADLLVEAIGPGRAAAMARRNWSLIPILHLVDSNRRSIGTDLPSHRHIAEGLQMLLERATANWPLLWFLDDLHVADQSTLEVIEQVAANLHLSRTLLVTTVRTNAATAAGLGQPQASGELMARLARIGQSQGVTYWEVPPLDAASVPELVQHAVGSVLPPEVTRALVHQSQGNPLYILQALSDAPSLLGGGGTGDRLDLPGILAAQFAALPEGHREVMMAAAVLGPETTTPVLRQVAVEEPDVVCHALADLVAGGWLQIEDQRVRFSHPLHQEITYLNIPRALLRSLHRLAGHVLLTVPGHPPQEIAQHFDAGADWEKAQEYHRQAGDIAASSFAYAEAAQHFRRCIVLGNATGHPFPDEAALALRAGELASRVEDPVSALAMLQYALQHNSDPAHQGVVLQELAKVNLYLGDAEGWKNCNTESVRVLRPLGPSRDLAKALMWQIRINGSHRQEQQAEIIAREAIAVCRQVASPQDMLVWMAGIGMNVAGTSDLDLARECLETVKAAARDLIRVPTPRVIRGLGTAALLANRLAELSTAQKFSRLVFRLSGFGGELPAILDACEGEARSLVHSGQLGLALERMQRHDGYFAQTTSSMRHYFWSETRARAYLYRGDHAQALRWALRARDVGQTQKSDYPVLADALLALLRMEQGETPNLEAWSPTRMLPAHYRSSFTGANLSAAAELQLAAGDPAVAQVLATAAEQLMVNRFDQPWARWVLGQAYLRQGDIDRGVRTLRYAAQSKGNAYYRALAWRDLAALATGAGLRHPLPRPSLARSYLERARALFALMDNQAQLARVAETARGTQWLAVEMA